MGTFSARFAVRHPAHAEAAARARLAESTRRLEEAIDRIVGT